MSLHIPNNGFARKAWAPFTGILAVGMLAWGLSLEGASVPGGSNRSLSVPGYDAPVPVALSSNPIRISTIPEIDYPIGPTYQVDPYNDIGSIGRREGRWTGAIPGPEALRDSAAVALGGCSFAIDCDDGNTCTADVCDIAPGQAEGQGTCVNNPVANGEQGTCADGVFCNGDEICSGGNVGQCRGVCNGGPNNGLACETSATTENGCPLGVCQNRVCIGGPTPGAACTYHQNCGTAGTCGDGPNPCTTGGQVCNEHFDNCQAGPCPGTSCDDLDSCTTETCVATVCTPGIPTCGLGADCLNRYCHLGGACTVANGCANQPCVTDLDCNSVVNACRTEAVTPLCFDGRCCTGVACTKAQRTGAGAAGCDDAGEDWYASDNGRLTTQNVCPPCPFYEAGIGDDTYTAVVGPASLSPSNNIMTGSPLRKVGDDFNACANAPSGYMSLTDMRFVGGVGTVGNSRTSFEFYDRNGNFEDDIFFITATNQMLVQRVEFLTPLIIDCQGFVVAHVLQNFAQNITDPGLFYWVAADGATSVDEGTNVQGTLYTDTDLNWTDASPPQPVANFIKVCAGPGLDAGTPCGSNANCDSGTCSPRATDVLAFELVATAVSAPNGACCKGGASPECNEETVWECNGEDGNFLGISTLCASCAGGTNPGGACRRCSGGPNNNLPCSSKDDCTGGTCALNNTNCTGGGVCTLNVQCNTGACCVTSNGDCELGHTLASCNAEPGSFQGYGSDCYPNCCEQPIGEYSGANHCDDAVVTVFNVEECIAPPDGTPCALGKGVCRGDECYVTVSGNNAAASSTTGDPDVCYPPNPTPGGELGWWEAFSVSDCAYLRIDHCCTDPVKIPAYRIIYDTCPCGQTVFTKRDPNVDEPPDGRGLPYCDEDNSWNKFGPLVGPNTYYYPILSFLGGDFGDYQFHISVKPCPNAVCCHNSCSNSSNTVCTDDDDCLSGEDCVNDTTGATARCRRICQVAANCTGGGACNASCGLMNQLECQDIGGAFLAPPNKATAVVTCGTVCNTGSCCTGPGSCIDEQANVPVAPSDCDGSPLVGRYVGGFRCFGGTCSGGANAGDSCAADSQCPGGVCAGAAGDLAQPTPCPICEIAAGDNCQNFDDSVNTRLSDLTVVGGTRSADDFRPNGPSITKVCVWGSYVEGDEDGNAVDCADDVSDNFEVIVYNQDADGLPNAVVDSSTSSGANVSKAHQEPSAYEDLQQIRLWAYQLTMDSAITGLDASGNTTYWIEVRNDTDTPAGNDCIWAWSNVDSAAFNDYSAAGGGSGYGPGAGRSQDHAFCLDVNFQPGAEVIRACCDCDEVCTQKSKRDCDNNVSSWDVTTLVCAGCDGLPPANDNCSAVVAGSPVPDGTYLWDNHCTSTDGPNPTPSELTPGGETLSNDVWYEYVATCEGTVVFTTCATGSSDGGGVDSFIGAYRDPGNRTVCSCPSSANHLGRLVGGSAFDENCTGILAGAGGFVEGSAQVGDCFMVRVGGFGGQGGEQGQGTLEISCTVGGLDAPTSGDNTCQTASTDLLTPCNKAADCTVANSGCMLKSRYLSITPTNAAVAGGTSIQVEVVTCPQFPSIVGDIFWAGAEVNIPNSPNPGLRGAPLLCSPTPANSQTWTAGVVHLWGQAVVPGSTYNVRMCDAGGGGCSDPLLVATAKWGDVLRPPHPVGAQPNFADINGIVQKFSNLASGPSMPRADIQGAGGPGTPNTPNQLANFADISNDVAAFGGFPYPYAVTTCP